MQYYILSIKKDHFIVTPDELRRLLADFHFVTYNGVKKNYTESDPDVFFSTYEALYNKLKNGEKLNWENDYPIVDFSTGITQYLENCVYKPTKKLYVPDFSEPCPWIATFSLIQWINQLSTAFAVQQFPENVCGLCLCFPTKTEYPVTTEKHQQGIVSSPDFDDYDSYMRLLTEIRKLTNPLRLKLNGKIHRTSIRISQKAKYDLGSFYFIKSNDITVI